MSYHVLVRCKCFKGLNIIMYRLFHYSDLQFVVMCLVQYIDTAYRVVIFNIFVVLTVKSGVYEIIESYLSERVYFILM